MSVSPRNERKGCLFLSQIIFELLIRFCDADDHRRQHVKAAVCAWFARKGRDDLVDGIVDGVEDALTEREHRDAAIDERRMLSAPVALYDRDRSVLEAMVSTLEKKFGAQLACDIHDLPDAAWQSSWREDFSAWQTNRFLITPVGSSSSPTHLQRIDIDARGGAFGTGQHTTTRCLLAMMEKHWRAWQPQSVLDVGAGTGILSIAAAKLGAKRIYGTEIDQQLVILARENAMRNQVHLQVTETSHPWQGECYDLVIANILVPVLHDLMPELQQCCAIGGRLLISGFITKEAGPIVAKAQAFGFEVDADEEEGGWHGVALRRSSPA